MTDLESNSKRWGKPLRGDEPFHCGGPTYEDALGQAKVTDFWRWGYSRLMADVTRGVLAEFIVARLIGSDMTNPGSPHREFDFRTASGHKVEVKSSAYVQDWNTRTATVPSFGGLKGKTYLDSDDYYESKTEPEYHSDIFVFCVLKEKDADTVDPLNLEQWDFYVLTRSALEGAGRPNSLSLSQICKLKAIACTWRELKSCVEAAER